MADVNIKYGTNNTATITLTSLAHTTARESTAVVNTGDLYLDAMAMVTLKTVTGTHSSDKCAYVWFYGSADATNFNAGITGTDAAYTISVPNNLRGPLPIIFPTSTTGLSQQKAIIGSVAAFFGGNLPQKWGMVVENKTGLALSATAADNAVVWAGIEHTVA